MIKNVIFDLGNVLIDCNPTEYIKKLGYSRERFQPVLEAILHDSLWSDLDSGKYESHEEIIEPYVAKHKEFEKEIRDFFSDGWMNFYSVYEDALAFYNSVYDAGYNIYILTNFSKDGFANISSRFDFFKKAKGIVVSSHIKVIKPNYRIYEYLFEKYDLKPNECVFIDDSPANIQAANELGVHGIIYKNCEQLKSDFQRTVEAE